MSEQNITPEQNPVVDPTATSATLGSPEVPVTADAEAFAAAQIATPETPTAQGTITPPQTPADTSPVDTSLAATSPTVAGPENPGVTPKGAKFERPSSAKRQKAPTTASTEPVAGRAPTAPTVRVTVAATSFDFLEGGYNKLRQLRLILLVCVGAALALMVGVTGAGITQSLSVQNINDDTARLVNQASQYTASYNDLTRLTINGHAVDGSIIKSAALARGTALQTVAAQQANMANILTQIYSLTSSGIQISGVSIVPDGVTTTPIPTKIEDVTFTATIANCSQVSSSITLIKSMPGFGSATVTVPSCSGSSMALTVLNKVTDSSIDTSTFNLNLLTLGQ